MTAEKSPKSFEQSMEKLEAIVSDLEEGEFSLEESLKKFEEGLKLGKRCRDILDKAEIRVKKLVETDETTSEEEERNDE